MCDGQDVCQNGGECLDGDGLNFTCRYSSFFLHTVLTKIHIIGILLSLFLITLMAKLMLRRDITGIMCYGQDVISVLMGRHWCSC